MDDHVTLFSQSESKSVSPSVVSHSFGSHALQPTRLLCPWDSPGKNTGVGCHSLLQGIFPTQESNLGLLHCRQIPYHLSHQGRPPSPKGMMLQKYSDWYYSTKLHMPFGVQNRRMRWQSNILMGQKCLQLYIIMVQVDPRMLFP